MQCVGVGAGDEKRVTAPRLEELIDRAGHDRRRATEAIGHGLTDDTRHAFRDGGCRAKHDIAALDVGMDVAAAGLDKHRCKVGHPKPILSSHVQPTQQRDVHTQGFRHLRLLSGVSSLVDRLEPQQRRLVGIGQHIKEPVRTLSDISNPLPEIGEKPFTP